MGIWYKEVTRLNYDLVAYIEFQDDWTGRISKHLREIKSDGNRYYCNFQHERLDVTEARSEYLRQEENIKIALERKNDKWR